MVECDWRRRTYQRRRTQLNLVAEGMGWFCPITVLKLNREAYLLTFERGRVELCGERFVDTLIWRNFSYIVQIARTNIIP